MKSVLSKLRNKLIDSNCFEMSGWEMSCQCRLFPTQGYTIKQWVTSQPPIVHFNLNLNYEKFICLFTLQMWE